MKAIVGTGGHIDHGKTALVGALTGARTDRLPEERRRGISIDLGFTHLEIDDDALGIVDVPGHEDFIRNMLAGATGIDLLLLVVAADEGVMPQTREHVAIAELLGVHDAVVALTKADLVDADWLELVREDVSDFLRGTPFAGADMVPTSATTGRGLKELRDALARAVQGTRRRTDDLFRLPVDRTFTVRGTGTVVTGTVWSGRLDRDAVVRLLPDGPTARVRGLQVHGRETGSIEAGERAAVALAGVDRSAVDRGMAVVTGDAWRATHMLTIAGRVLPAAGWSIEPRQRLRVHLGTAEVMARATLLDGETFGPGDHGWIQLRLERPLLARAGDRLVLRSYSPVTTIGGGTVVEPLPPKRTRLAPAQRDRLERRARGSVEDRIAALLEEAAGAGVVAAELPIRTPASPAEATAVLDRRRAVRAGELVFAADAAASVRAALLDVVDAHHAERPLQPGIEPEKLRAAAPPAADAALVDRVLAGLVEERTVVRTEGRVARPGFTPELSGHQAALRDRVLRTLADAGVSPPRVEELAADLGNPAELGDLLRLLEAEGRIARVEHDLFMDGGALERAAEAVRSALGGRTGLGPADFRDVLGVSRRHLIPLLEYLDRAGVTRRSADGRAVARPGE